MIINPKKINNHVNFKIAGVIVVIGLAVLVVILWIFKTRKRNKDLSTVCLQNEHLDKKEIII